ncbi:MFS transporter [bacterium]|nr:MFS transporter [bacterium]
MKKGKINWKKRFSRKEKRYFARLWASHFFSQIANYILLFLILGRTFEITRSTVAIGMVWVGYILPTLLIGPFSGSLVDCWSKKRTLVYTNVIQALLTLIYGLSFYLGKKYLVYGFIFFYSVVNQFNNPAELAAIPAIVKKKNLVVANNILLFTDQASFILGSGLSGILTRLFTPVKVVFIAAAVIILSGLSAALLPHDIPAATIEGFQSFFDGVVSKIKEGYQFLITCPLLLYSFGLALLFRVVTTTSALLIPSISSEILKLTPYDASYLVVFPLACGIVGGTLILTRHQFKLRKKGWIAGGLTSMGAFITLFSLLLPSLPRGRVLLAPLFSFIIGLSASIAYAPCQAFIQENTPLEVRGRVFGTLDFLMTLAVIPPSIFTAMLTDLISVRLFLAFMGLLILFLGGFILKRGNELILAANHRS